MHWLEKLIKSACNCLLSVSQALELEMHALNEFTFQMNSRQLFRPFGYSSVVSSCLWYVLRYVVCGKTVLERFQFLYFSGQSSRHQAYLAVASDSDGHSASRLGLWSLSVLRCDLAPAWINSNSLKRVWKGPSVCQLNSTARAGDGTYLQLGGTLLRPPSPCHRRRTAPSRLALLSVKKASSGKMSQPSASSYSLWSERSIRSCSSAMSDAFVLEKMHQLYKAKKVACWCCCITKKTVKVFFMNIVQSSVFRLVMFSLEWENYWPASQLQWQQCCSLQHIHRLIVISNPT